MNDEDKAKVYVFLMKQDDPKKCTSAKLVRFNIVKPIYSLSQINKKMIVLNPFAKTILSKSDLNYLLNHGIVVIDCSWEKSTPIFKAKNFRGINRRLPLLVAANPINYGKIGKLSSAEALYSALFIIGFKFQAEKMISIFKWGKTFSTLNADPLEEYSKAKDDIGIYKIEKEFF